MWRYDGEATIFETRMHRSLPDFDSTCAGLRSDARALRLESRAGGERRVFIDQRDRSRDVTYYALLLF